MLKIGSEGIQVPGLLAAYVGDQIVHCGLPSGYTRANYVRGNANAHFATSLYLNQDCEVIAVIQFEGSAGNTYGCFSGTSASDNFCLYAGATASDAYIRYNGQVVKAFKATNGTRYKLIHNRNGFWANGAKLADAFTASTFTCSNPFCVGTLSGSTSAKLKGRIYSIVVKEGSATRMALIPAKNSSDVYGLYDAVGRQFYSSEGTAFTGA